MIFGLYESVSLVYRIVFFLHVLAVIVGFGSSFVYPMLAAASRKLDDPGQKYAINHAALGVSKMITTPVIYAAGALGVLLVLLSGQDGVMTIKFSETWISIALLLFIIAVAVAAGLHVPNLKAMDGLAEKLAAGQATPSKAGPPKEVLELQERGKKAGMYGGILHLLFLLLLLDMIFKPGITF